VIARFESTVDGYANASLNWYFPCDEDYIIFPQWSYRRPVTDSKNNEIQRQWSQRPEGSFTDLPESESAEPRSSTPLAGPSATPLAGSSATPLAGPLATEIDILNLPTTNLPSHVDILVDEFNRAVDNGSIQKPDFLAALLRSVRDHALIIVEDKLSNRVAARRQLLGYMNDFREQYPYILGLAFVMNYEGLYVGLFERSREDGEIKQLENGSGISWMSPLDDYFHQKMIEVIQKAREID
jgi:hypothetical protein